MDDREVRLTRVTAWGAAANVTLAAVKFVAGIAGHSAAMTADAIHSLSDLVSDVIVLAMVHISSRGKDKSHDYGHGKFETLATLGVSILLLVVGGKLIADGIAQIRDVLEGKAIPGPGRIAFFAALISIAVKEALYQWTAYTGRKYSSPAVIANAWHHRTDALSSIASAIGIGTALLLGERWVVLDPIVSCGISTFIIYIAVKMAMPALEELSEASLPDAIENEIVGLIRATSGVQDVHALKTRKNGPYIIIDAHIVVSPDLNVVEAHKITVDVERSLKARYGRGTQISLHVEPDCEAE